MLHTHTGRKHCGYRVLHASLNCMVFDFDSYAKLTSSGVYGTYYTCVRVMLPMHCTYRPLSEHLVSMVLSYWRSSADLEDLLVRS